MSSQNVVLRIENFYNDEDIDLRIESKKEIQAVLQRIANLGTHVAVYYGNQQNFILTVLLGVNDSGFWLDIGSSPIENKQLLLNDKVTLVSVHQNVKIQFVSHDITSGIHKDGEAFYLKLPDYMVRIQRREFFRAHIPVSIPLSCTIPMPAENTGDPVVIREIPLLDISGNGVGLLCSEYESELLPGKIFPDCQIEIPDFGTLKVTIEVQNGINFTSRNNIVQKRVGCYFAEMDNQMTILLQRYINYLQRESLT